MKTKLRNTFIAGLAVILPLVLTILAFRWLVETINSLVLNPLVDLLKPFVESKYAVLMAKFGVFFTVILVILIIGSAAKIIVVREFFGLWEKVFLKIPLVGKIYESLKQFSGAVLGGEGNAVFKSVVIVEYPRKGVYQIGFVTGNTEGELKDAAPEGLVNVLFPHTPNPASGFLALIKKEDIIETSMTVEDGIKMIISGGFVGRAKPDKNIIAKKGNKTS